MRKLPKGTFTLLFSDIEGSTRSFQQEDEHSANLLEEARHLLHTTCITFHGHEIDIKGEAFTVTFAHASDAVSAAIHGQRALTSHPLPEGTVLQVRMGLHTCELEWVGKGYTGPDVHHGAYIMSAGHGGQVLLSQVTCELLKRDLPAEVILRDLGVHRLKDFRHPERLFQLVISGVPSDFPPLKTLDSRFNDLPLQPTPLIGREQEVGAVLQLLQGEEVRLVTLTGPGGIGKTRLGLQVANELSNHFADGVFFVDLSSLSDSALVVPTIAQTLGVREMVGQPMLLTIQERLRQEQVLLLLDNFEQVLSASVQIAELLAACPYLKILVTSREALHVRAEQEYAVPALALPDAKSLLDLRALAHTASVALFLQRAQAVKPDFHLTTANAVAVVELCIRLDGLPLALELAAARIKLLPPKALLARLDKRLALLTSIGRDVPSRQQTLSNTIAWSYDLLTPEEQSLFRRLCVFVDGCTLEAVAVVCHAVGDLTMDVVDGATSLMDKSLLQQVEQEEEPRLLLLETVREYGLECLTANGEMEAALQAHATYYLALAEEAESERGDSQQQAAWLERERDNLRAAMRWFLEQGEAGLSYEMALRLGGALRRFWLVHGHWSEGQSFLRRALAGSEGVTVSAQVKALSAAAHLTLKQGDYDQGEALAKESLVLYRELGDTAGIALSLYLLGSVSWLRGNYVAARSQTEESLALWREVGDQESAAWSLFNLAIMLIEQGDYFKGRALFDETLRMHRELGNKRGIAASLLWLAWVIYHSQGDPATERSQLEEGLALFRELGDKENIADSLNTLGWVVLQQGETAVAHALAEESVVLFREMGRRHGIAESCLLLARVAAVQGNHTAARALYEGSLALCREDSDKWDIAFGLEGLASVVAAQGELAWASRLWGAAEALREAISAPLPSVFRADHEQAVAATRLQLSEQVFAATWAEGRTMTPGQALAAQGPAATPTDVSPPPYPDGLTAREVDVLRLVAQGLTNAQIAEKLIVSPHTVHAHVSSIHSKLGLSTRSAVTRYAFEHHLA